MGQEQAAGGSLRAQSSPRHIWGEVVPQVFQSQALQGFKGQYHPLEADLVLDC